MGENLDPEVALSYLADVKKQFLAKYTTTQISNAFSYQFKEFSGVIQKLAQTYEKNPASKLQLLKDKLGETSNILTENVEKLLERKEKLSIIAVKSKRLNETSDDYLANIKEIKRRQKWKKYKHLVIAGLIGIVAIFLIYFLFIK